MYSHRGNPWGIFYLTLGAALFLYIAGAFLLRLLVALFALWLMSYGIQMLRGRSSFGIFWRWPRS